MRGPGDWSCDGLERVDRALWALRPGGYGSAAELRAETGPVAAALARRSIRAAGGYALWKRSLALALTPALTAAGRERKRALREQLVRESAYRERERARAIELQRHETIEREARRNGSRELFVLTTQAEHWFKERGFVDGEVDALPVERRELYNWRRGSKVLVKPL